jgi:hypothetical protein
VAAHPCPDEAGSEGGGTSMARRSLLRQRRIQGRFGASSGSAHPWIRGGDSSSTAVQETARAGELYGHAARRRAPRPAKARHACELQGAVASCATSQGLDAQAASGGWLRKEKD